MKGLPNISNNFKTQIILLLIITDKILIIWETFILMLVLNFYIYHFFTFPMETHPWFAKLLVHIEFLFGVYEVKQIVQSALFF